MRRNKMRIRMNKKQLREEIKEYKSIIKDSLKELSKPQGEVEIISDLNSIKANTVWLLDKIQRTL